MIWELQRLGLFAFQLCNGCPRTTCSSIIKTWSIVIQGLSHQDWSNVCNTFSYSFAIVMKNT
jgi:hypothetical protein